MTPRRMSLVELAKELQREEPGLVTDDQITALELSELRYLLELPEDQDMPSLTIPLTTALARLVLQAVAYKHSPVDCRDEGEDSPLAFLKRYADALDDDAEEDVTRALKRRAQLRRRNKDRKKQGAIGKERA